MARVVQAAVKGDPVSSVDDWLEDDNLELLECWARDGYTLADIADKMGIHPRTLSTWRVKYPEIERALKKGREIIDYKVENALLKSALGYKTKEVKVTTTMRYGKVVETVREVTDKDQAPNVTACQVWLYNRLPSKWKRNRDKMFEVEDEDTTVQITVTRAGKELEQPSQPDASTVSEHKEKTDEKRERKPFESKTQKEEEEWQDEVNRSIRISNSKREEKQYEEEAKKEQQKAAEAATAATDEQTKASDLDYWPEDWEEED